MKGVFNSPSLLLKIFLDGFVWAFCCCSTACLNVSSNGLAIIMVLTAAFDNEIRRLEVVGCIVGVGTVTTAATGAVAGAESAAVSPDGPDLITTFCKSLNRPMSSQCLMNVFGVGSCC